MRRFGLTCFAIFIVVSCAAAQDDQGKISSSQQSSTTSMQGMDMSGMVRNETQTYLPAVGSGSGTGWQPSSVPTYEWMLPAGAWDVMVHGVIFATFNHQGGPRGAGKAQSANWAMFMEAHRLGRGTLVLRQMFSAESLTAPHPGFPELFQTGETYHGFPLVDHQHPHNVFSELSLYYGRPLFEHVSWFVYGGPAAEPALGPVTYLHRASAAELSAAPLGHHLQDSTHTSFGVVTTGFVISRFKVEGSAFNGREPNEQRWSIQLNSLDSWSGRVSVAPSRNWTAQYSYGYLVHPEALEPNNQRRQTASISYNRPFQDGNWATSLIWGRKHKTFEPNSQNSYLLESTLNFMRRNYAYTRLELIDKDELFPGVPSYLSYRIGAYTFGGERDLVQNRVGQIGLEADVTFYSKSAALDAIYGDHPVSFSLSLRFRPALKAQHGH